MLGSRGTSVIAAECSSVVKLKGVVYFTSQH